MKSKSKATLPILLFLLFLLAVLLFVFQPYFKTPQLGGSARADLLQQVTEVYGAEYEGKVLSETDTDAGMKQVRENLRISMEPDKYRRWKEGMPTVDFTGDPFPQEGWISIYTVTVEYTRFAVVNAEVDSDSQQTMTITYTAYEDQDINSGARATLDLNSAETSYSTDAKAFDDMAK